MSYWTFWQGGLALAGIALAHYLLTGRLMAVSGRFSALINRARFGGGEPEPELDEAALLAALQGATADAFGSDAVGPAPEPGEDGSKPISASKQPWWLHLAFILALVGGGAIAAAQTGTLTAGSGIRGVEFSRVFGTGPLSYWPLLLGGLLVGFGTRMAGGCTSGHGLCGVSRVQTGSLLATCAFFGAGIGVSLLLRAVAG